MSKVIKKNKGTVSHYDDESFEFHPYGKGEPVYDHTHKVGGGTLGFDKLVIDTKECKASNDNRLQRCVKKQAEGALAVKT